MVSPASSDVLDCRDASQSKIGMNFHTRWLAKLIPDIVPLLVLV